MTIDSAIDEASSTSQTSSSSLDVERIQRFMLMPWNEICETWHLSSTSSSPLPRSQNSSESITNTTNWSSEDQSVTTKNDAQTTRIADLIPNNDISIPFTDRSFAPAESAIPSTPISLSHSSATSQPHRQSDHQQIPARIFRQRQPKQLQPFTEDRKQYHFLIGRKERLAALGGHSKRRTPSPTPQSFGEYDPSYIDRIPSDEEYYDYDDSDGFVDDLGGDNLVDKNNSQQSANTENDGHSDELGQFKKKKRRIVITDDSDEGLDSGRNDSGDMAPAARPSSSRNNNNNKGDDYDIFAIPLDQNPERLIKHKRKSTTKCLITYDRKKKTSKRHRNDRPINSQQSVINTFPSSPLPPNDFDIFDIESIDNGKDQQARTTQHNMDANLNDISDALVQDGCDGKSLDKAIAISTPTPPATPQLSETHTRQSNHGSVRKVAYGGGCGDSDDDGFIVDDDDYGRERRRRNTTLREIRKNKRHLKGILPTSFTMIYNKQLEEEENYKRVRVSTDATKRKSSQDIGEHGDDPIHTSSTEAANNTGSDHLATEATIWDDDDSPSPHLDTLDASAFGCRFENSNTIADSRQYEDEQRNRRNENIPMDCGVQFLRNGAASITKLTYMDNEHFALFHLRQETSLPTSVLDQPFVDTDYYTHSPTITLIFESAYQSFSSLWSNFKNNDFGETGKNAASGPPEENMTSFLGFLRFVSLCIAKGYQRNKCETDIHGTDGIESGKTSEMQQFLISEMDNLADRILDLVNWKDDGIEMARLNNGDMNHGTNSPLLLAFVYFVEWSYQLRETMLVNPLNTTYIPPSLRWTLKASLRRVLWYLLSLGPSSVSMESVTGLLFHVHEPKVMEAWMVVLQLIKLENLDSSTLWSSLQDFLELTEKPSFLEKIGNTGGDTVVWNKVEVTWKWVLTIASLQRIQKDACGYGKVKAAEVNHNGRCWGPIQQLLREIIQQKAAIGNLSMTDKTLLHQFRSLTLIRLTFWRCHFLVTKYNWMWDSKTLQQLYDLVHIPQLQAFTGDPMHPQQYQHQQDKATAAKYFPYYFTNYDGTIPDDEVNSMDTCGIIFLKILSFGLRKRVNMILESSSNSNNTCNHVGSDGDIIGVSDSEQRENLQTCLARVMPAYLVAGDVSSSGKSSSFLLYNLVSNPASSLNQDQKVNPLVSFSYEYTINMAILHATAQLGNDNNVGLDVLRSNFEFHTRLETEKACAEEITLEALRIYEMIKKKWCLE